MQTIDSINFDEYTDCNIIYTSHKGFVIEGFDKNNIKVLLKSFIKINNDSSFIKDELTDEIIPKELYFLKQLTGEEYIPKLIDYHDGIKTSTIVMEFFDNEHWIDLFEFSKECYDETIIKKVIKNTIRTMYKLSDIGYYHQDIKPENIMVNKTNLEIKFIDLEDMFYSDCDYPCCIAPKSGTIGYKSPESFLQEPYDVKPSFVFNIGCLVYFCLEKRYTYDSKRENMKCSPLKFRKSSKFAISFIRNCTSSLNFDRLDYDNLLQHDWFRF